MNSLKNYKGDAKFMFFDEVAFVQTNLSFEENSNFRFREENGDIKDNETESFARVLSRE